MSQSFTFHDIDTVEKCPKCEEILYIVSPGVLRCTACDYQEDAF